MSLALPNGRGGRAFCPPAEFEEVVEMYAREYGRHATLEYIPPINCWTVEFTLKPDDPRMKGWKQGRLTEEPKEVVYLWRWSKKQNQYVGYKLSELGTTGLREFLEKGNSWGRGQSLVDAVNEQEELRVKGDEKRRLEGRANARDLGMDKRRTELDIPYLGVDIDLKAPTTAPGAEAE